MNTELVARPALPHRRFIQLAGGGAVLVVLPLASCSSANPPEAVRAWQRTRRHHRPAPLDAGARPARPQSAQPPIVDRRPETRHRDHAGLRRRSPAARDRSVRPPGADRLWRVHRTRGDRRGRTRAPGERRPVPRGRAEPPRTARRQRGRTPARCARCGAAARPVVRADPAPPHAQGPLRQRARCAVGFVARSRRARPSVA